jgi:hypothetical protein
MDNRGGRQFRERRLAPKRTPNPSSASVPPRGHRAHRGAASAPAGRRGRRRRAAFRTKARKRPCGHSRPRDDPAGRGCRRWSARRTRPRLRHPAQRQPLHPARARPPDAAHPGGGAAPADRRVPSLARRGRAGAMHRRSAVGHRVPRRARHPCDPRRGRRHLRAGRLRRARGDAGTDTLHVSRARPRA